MARPRTPIEELDRSLHRHPEEPGEEGAETPEAIREDWEETYAELLGDESLPEDWGDLEEIEADTHQEVAGTLDEEILDAPPGGLELEEERGTIGSESGEYFTTPEESEQARLRVHDVQVALAALGYLEADLISDRWDLPAKDALATFQADAGFPITGQLDPDSYEELLGAYEAGLETQQRGQEQDAHAPIHAGEPLRKEKSR